MQVNLFKNVLDVSGTPSVSPDGKLTKLNEELARGLSQAQETENALRLWELSKKIYTAKQPVDLEASDVELIKKHLARGLFTAGFTGQVLEALAKAL
jgi:hypothetical protein